MSVIVSVFYPLWYNSYRNYIKDILNSDTTSAKTLLDEITAQHDTITDPEENLHLHHAQDHLNSFQLTDQTHQKDATINALDEQ
jgi:hypothetical protein